MGWHSNRESKNIDGLDLQNNIYNNNNNNNNNDNNNNNNLIIIIIIITIIMIMIIIKVFIKYPKQLFEFTRIRG